MTVVEQVPLEVPPNAENERYLRRRSGRSSDTASITRVSARAGGDVSERRRRPGRTARRRTSSRPSPSRSPSPSGAASPSPSRPEHEPAPEPVPEEERSRRPAAEHAAGDIEIPDDVDVLEGEAGPTRRLVAVVVSKFNGEITTQLLESALAELDEVGVARRS